MKKRFISSGLGLIIISFLAVGCVGGIPNQGSLEIFRTPVIEATWIRNGEPLEYEKELWYPKDNVDNLIDAEVLLLGEFRGVQFFVEKTDVKPYKRLYTKFGRNKYRAYDRTKGK